ncbi:hypothetical protein OROMI_002568 [Orobanche minor]
MTGGSRYEIHRLKVVFHALKHRTSTINGVLLDRSSADGSAIEITDSVPLFHSQIGLLPPLEIALIMIEEYDDFELPSVAMNIGDHITRYFPQAAVLLLDNRRLEDLSKGKDRIPVMQETIDEVLKEGGVKARLIGDFSTTFSSDQDETGTPITHTPGGATS